MGATLTLLRSFFPPELSGTYLLALLSPFAETLGLTIAAMSVVVLVGTPLAVAAALRLRGAWPLVQFIGLLRSVPDLTLAIFCVILFGIGTGAGLAALILYYVAAVTKAFADLLDTVPQGPVEAVAATGASRLQTALFATLPLARADLFTYGAFAFECALRSSVIVGAVGGGGIGVELVGTLAGFEFRRASTLILVMVLVIAGLDRAALWLRGRPGWLLPLIPIGLAAAWLYGPDLFAGRHAIQVVESMLPPRLDGDALAALPRLIGETIAMALAGTLGGAVLGLFAAALAARAVAPGWLAFATRRFLELLRTVPEVVWGLVLVVVVGVGPVAGALALGLHSLGSLGRLFADSLDSAPRAPQEALALTGASQPAVLAYATIPLALRPVATHLLFRLDWNLRMATVLGLIGAGGIGGALYEAQQLFFYDRVLAYLLVTAAVILVVDWMSARWRIRLNSPAGSRARTRLARAATLAT